MSGLKSGAIVVLLAIPFALYSAWQVQGVTRADMIVSDPPSDKGLPTKEQLAAVRGKAEKWAVDVRKASVVVYQYRAPVGDDKADDEDCNKLAKAVALRAADLGDLDTFLSDREKRDYVGNLQAQYAKWQVSKAVIDKAEKAVNAWFVSPIGAVDGPDTAAKVLEGFVPLVEEYSRDTRFSDRLKAATWRMKARIRVIEALQDAATDPYKKVLQLKLPFPAASANADVRKALNAPRGIREQVKLLQQELAQARENGLPTPPALTDAVKEAVKQSEEWAAKEQLLGLFAEPTLFTDPNGAADWLGKVQAQFNRTTTAEGKALIHQKVQEFCEAYVPRVVALDDKVLLNGKPLPRSAVTIDYPAVGGKRDSARLSPLYSGLNEFNVAERYPDPSTRVIFNDGEFFPKQLEPTTLSRAAETFMKARAELESGTGGPRWSAKSIGELKNKCNALASEVNKLKTPSSKTDALQLADRLTSLAQGAADSAQLFEKGP